MKLFTAYNLTVQCHICDLVTCNRVTCNPVILDKSKLLFDIINSKMNKLLIKPKRDFLRSFDETHCPIGLFYDNQCL